MVKFLCFIRCYEFVDLCIQFVEHRLSNIKKKKKKKKVFNIEYDEANQEN